MGRVQSHQSHCTLVLRAALPLLLLVSPAAWAAQARQASRSGAAPHQDDAHHAGGGDAVYAVPVPHIDALTPRGLRISIPDEAGISQVRFHLGVNKALSPQRLGTVNVEVSHRTGAVWTYEDRTTILREQDVVHYWLQVTRAGHEYERAGSHYVQGLVEMYDVGVGLTPLSAPAAPPPRKQPPAPPPPPPCTRSRTSVNGRLVCQGEQLFLENFDDLDASAGAWRHDVHLAGQPDFEFTAFTQSPANTYTVNGQLVIRPTLTDDVYGRDFVRTGRLQLENCTVPEHPEQCSRQARYGYILPPVLSGRVSTRRSFSFRYGVLEMRAKLPSGDWIYPELWLLPREEAYGAGLKSGRIQVALARGNAELHLGATELGLRRLEAGALASAGLGAGPASHDVDDEAIVDPPNVVTFAGVPPRAATTTTTTTTTRRPSTTTARTTTASRSATTRTPSSSTRTGGQQKSGAASTSRATSTAAPKPATTRTTPSPTRSTSPPRSSGHVAPSGSGSGSAPVRNTAQSGSAGSSGVRGYYPSPPAPLMSSTPQLRTTTPSFVGFWPDDGGSDSGDSGWPRTGRRGRRGRASRAVSSGSGYKGPSRKEVSRTELPGRPWSSSFHNYTLRWTPDEMVFSVDGVELGVLDPETTGGLLRSSTNPEDDPWHGGSRMAPFDREFYISLGLAVGGIHNFPEGVEGPNRSKKPWKNTAAKAMLSFWNAKDEWYESWSTDSALLVDFVRVTAL